MAVITALPTFRHEGKPFLAFVYGICAHKVADAHRAASRSRSHSVADVPDAPSTERGPEQRVVANSTAAVIDGLLGTLARNAAGDPSTAGRRRAERRGNRRGIGDDGRRGSGVPAPRAGQTSASAVHRRLPDRAVGVMEGRPGRSGRRRQDHSSPLVDVDIVFADDRLIDRIAQSPWGPAERTSTGGAHRRDARRPAYSELATADPLTELFETWRDELAADPMPALPRLRPTLVPQVAERPPKRRSMRPALAIAAAIAALLVGTATIGSKNADAGIGPVGYHPGGVAEPGGVRRVREDRRGSVAAGADGAGGRPIQGGPRSTEGGHRGARQDRSCRWPR